MTDQSLPGQNTPCPSCGTDVDLTGTPGDVVACPVCQAEVPVVGPDPIASDDVDVTEVLRAMRGRGYEADLTVAGDGRVVCGSCGMQLDAADVQVDDVRRVRDLASGDDTVAAVALTCPNCRARGTLVLDFGADGDAAHTELLGQFEWGHVPS